MTERSGAKEPAAAGRPRPDVPMPRIRDPHISPREDAGETAPSFRQEPYPTTYGSPDRSRLKRALRAYVMGHDRGWEAERKLAEADRPEQPVDRPDRFRGPPAEGEVQADEIRATSSGLPEGVDVDVPEAPIDQLRFGVPVPERLAFHRGPDVWRDRIARSRVVAPGQRPSGNDPPAPRERPSGVGPDRTSPDETSPTSHGH